MYRLARDHPVVVTSMPAVWYLKKCAETLRGAWSRLGGRWYMQQGLMAGSIWLDVLRDLQLEASPPERSRSFFPLALAAMIREH
jgi:hypothetical protein